MEKKRISSVNLVSHFSNPAQIQRQLPKNPPQSRQLLVAIGGWRLVEIAGWRLAVGGWRRLAAVGGSWQLVMGG